jgi:hypothetical protein
MLAFCGVEAQYISEVLSYSPAPGQFINSAPWGTPLSARSIVGGVNGSLSLGAFGGSVVFRFEEAVENHLDNPFGVDFTIFGNPMEQWSEPGVVFVMEDENRNGIADDTWYEIAGSDHFFSTTQRDYQVTYLNPDQSVAADVPWEDQEGNQGFIRANSVHPQPYYPLNDSFPSVTADAATYTGTRLEGAVDVDHPPILISARRAFGYTDNLGRGSAPYILPDNPYTEGMENSGGDAIDISWAVDEEGRYVELEKIHFVKVQSGILHEGGFLGELSTEITGAVDIPPVPGIAGTSVRLVLKELPPEMDASPFQLEAFLFRYGRLDANRKIRWTTNQEWAVVNDEGLLNITGSGPLTISATVDEEPQLSATVSTIISQDQSTSIHDLLGFSMPGIFPNPAGEVIHIQGVDGIPVTLFDASGRVLKHVDDYRQGAEIPTGNLKGGVYLLKVGNGTPGVWLRFLKL